MRRPMRYDVEMTAAAAYLSVRPSNYQLPTSQQSGKLAISFAFATYPPVVGSANKAGSVDLAWLGEE